MCVSYPDFCCGGHTGGSPLSPVPDANGKNITLDAIANVLGELASLSPDEFFHLGGDEVSQACWNSTPAVRAWMAAHGMNTTDEVCV